MPASGAGEEHLDLLLPATSVHIVVYADEKFQRAHPLQLQSLRCFSEYWKYHFHVLPWTTDGTPCGSPGASGDPMFARHCLFADFLKREVPANETALLLESDVAASGLRPGLDYHVANLLDVGRERHHRTDERTNERTNPATFPRARTIFSDDNNPQRRPYDLMFFERVPGPEIDNHNDLASGIYMVRNTPAARRFLHQWAEVRKRQPDPPAVWSNSDNGGMYLALFEATALAPREKAEECTRKYVHLKAPSWNPHPYGEFVGCCRELMGMGNNYTSELGRLFEKGKGVTLEAKADWEETTTHARSVISDLRVKILPHNEAFAADWYSTYWRKTHSALGHYVKDIESPIRRKWFTWRDVENCVDFDGTTSKDPHPSQPKKNTTKKQGIHSSKTYGPKLIPDQLHTQRGDGTQKALASAMSKDGREVGTGRAAEDSAQSEPGRHEGGIVQVTSLSTERDRRGFRGQREDQERPTPRGVAADTSVGYGYGHPRHVENRGGSKNARSSDFTCSSTTSANYFMIMMLVSGACVVLLVFAVRAIARSRVWRHSYQNANVEKTRMCTTTYGTVEHQ